MTAKITYLPRGELVWVATWEAGVPVTVGRDVAVGPDGVAEGAGEVATATGCDVTVGAGEGVGEVAASEETEGAGVTVGDEGMDVAGVATAVVAVVVVATTGVPVTPRTSV